MSPPLQAVPLPFDAGMSLAAACEAADPAADFAGSLPWLQAAARTLGTDRIVHVGLRTGASGPFLGHLALQRTRAAWRSGVPGRATLCWPMAEIGFGFRPRWREPTAGGDWLAALHAAWPDHRIELRRTAADALVGSATPAAFTVGAGIGTWALRQPLTEPTWLAGLRGKHRRDLHKYRRDIDACGGTWLDSTAADPDLLAACFQLHRSRLGVKGARSAYFAATVEQFLRELAAATAGEGLRLSLLRRDGRFVAACLSFVHRRRYKAFVSGWDRASSRLDLGRQVLFHQILSELRVGLDEIDLLGGDLAYKAEFGLHKQPTVDLVAHGGVVERWCEQLLHGALQACRRLRTQRVGP